MMKITNKSCWALITLLLCLCVAGIGFQSCSNDDESFYLDAYGPSEVERGGEIYFIGNGLDKVKQIILLDETKGDDEEGREWVFDKSDFLKASSGKITLRIPSDYPLDRKGPAKIIYSGGVYITMNAFMVLNVTSVFASFTEEFMDQDHPLEPGKWIAVQGKVLQAVDSVIFDNGVRIYKDAFIEHTDQIIKFILPADVGTGATFKLKVPGRSRMEETSVDVDMELYLPLPSAGNFVSADERPIRVCASMKFSVERLDRLDYDHQSNEITVAFDGIDYLGTIDVATKTVTVDLPRNKPGGETAVMLYSFGKQVETKASFSVQTFEFDSYDPEIIPASGAVTFYVSGLNLCAVKEMAYETTTMSQGEYVMTPPYLVEGASPRINMDGDRLRLNFLTNYHRGGKIVFTLHDGTKVELPVLGYVGM